LSITVPARRPKVTDDEILAAAQRAMARHGPHELTLAHIADEAGVTAGRLVQRYGSKRDLMVSLSQQFAVSASDTFARLRAQGGTALATIRAYATCVAALAPTPEALLRNVAYLHVDLADDALRESLLSNARQSRKEIEALVKAAVRNGELVTSVDAPGLARTIETIIGGSLMAWATYREGAAATYMHKDLDAVLAPWIAPTRIPRKRR
jgi:AcrR family transcriptional regulator